jgi:hypothetical protein
LHRIQIHPPSLKKNRRVIGLIITQPVLSVLLSSACPSV